MPQAHHAKSTWAFILDEVQFQTEYALRDYFFSTIRPSTVVMAAIFNALDQAKYGAFKAEMLNRWNTKAMKPPTTVNEIYRMAGSWVKVAPKTEAGLAAAYALARLL